MNEYDHTYQFPIDSSAPQQAERAIDLSNLLWVLRKGWKYPFLGCLVCLALAVAFVMSRPAFHSSTAQLLIDRSLSQYLTSNRIVGQPSFDIGSQVYILKSDSVLVPVVRSLNLVEDPEFVGSEERDDERAGWSVSKLKKYVKDSLGLKPRPKAGLAMPRERIAVEALLGHLSIFRADVPTVINITVDSVDPTKAATIANRIAETYLATIQDAKNLSTKLAAKFLQERLEELKEQLVEAEKALQKFRLSHNLSATNSGTRLSEQIARLRSQLIEAKLAMTVSRERIESAKKVGEVNLIGVLADDKTGLLGVRADNSVITRLRVRRLELVSEVRSLKSRVGEGHPSVKKLVAKIGELDSALRGEGERIWHIYKSQYFAQKQRVSEIEAAIAAFSEKLKAENQSKTKLQELQAAAKSFTTLYNNALQQYNQIPQAALSDDARIISKATPSQRKSSKKSWLIIGASIAFGLMMGAAVPIGRDLLISPFRTVSQVRREFGLTGVVLPVIRKTSFWRFRRRKDGPMEEWVLNFPLSRFADGIRNIEAGIFSTNEKAVQRVVCVTSCVPGEGKTTVLANLAASIAAEPWGRRVLAIDCDFHKRNMTKALAPEAAAGLLEALTEPSDLASLIIRLENSNVDVLPCAVEKPVADAAKILGSGAMGMLLDAARGSYDVVLIDVPPVMSVVDVKMIERFVDGFVLVMEWGVTRRRLVREALAEMDFLQNRLICAVLNKADISALEVLESYKGQRWEEYYNS